MKDAPVQASAEQARIKEAHLSLIYESVSDVIYLLAVEPEDTFRFLSVNRAFFVATGLRADQVIGKRIEEVLPPASHELVKGKYRQTMRERRRVDWEEVADYPAGKKVGEVTVAPIFDDAGRCTHLLGSVHDVTERARAEEMRAKNLDLEAANHRIREASRIQSQFFANISHELRTPLALILGPTENLLSSGTLAEEHRRDLEVVRRNAQLLLKHVNDLLDASKLEAGKMGMSYAESDLAELVRVVAGHFDVFAREKEIDFAIHAAGGVRAHVDPEKLQRVLLNLVSNAFKVTPPRGKIRCELRTDANRSHVAIEVADGGPGIPPEQRDEVFERFRQIEGGPAQRLGGTGLGLAIARDFVQMHGGTISIADAPEGGALFTVEIPLVAPEGVDLRPLPTDAAPLAEMARPMVPEFESPTDVPDGTRVDKAALPLVLVIEDNPEMNRFVCQSLASEYRVEAAFHGREGLAKALALRPDLILSDIMMPELSGDDLVRAVRGRRELEPVPIVLLTAKADDELKVRLLREGANDYVMKPFSVEELRARLRNLIRAKLADDRNRQLNAEVHEHNVRLTRLTAQLEEANRELEAFSYSVSHDLRAPLRGMDGFSQALLEDYADKLDEEGKDYLRRVRGAAQRMATLIDDMLCLSQVTRSQLQHEMVDLSALAQSVAVELVRAHPDRAVRFSAETGIVAQGDPGLLRVALENLLGNAWKFTEGRPDSVVEFGTMNLDGEVVYFVRDNGAGFDMAFADRLFAPFQRLHPESAFPGTGIGLATVQRIVRRHGGRIWADSAPGAGATFFLILGGQVAQ